MTTGINTVIYGKEGAIPFEINPKTVATQVHLNDVSGADSNVENEIVKIRQQISDLQTAGVSFKGAVSSTNPLPTVSYKSGWQYSVAEAGTYAGQTCEVGDLILCVKDYASGSASNKDWVVLQVNIVGAVTGPSSSVANRVAVFDGTSGKQIKDSGFTLGKSVPADALFTDTTYKAATASSEGLMSANDFSKLAGIEAAADKTDTANVSAAGAFMLATNTADNIKDGSSKVVMTSSERTKLSGVAAGAEVNQNSFSTVKVGDTSMASTGKTDTFEIAAGDGITLTPGTKKVTITETYVDSCVVSNLDNIPTNLRNGGLIILKQ